MATITETLDLPGGAKPRFVSIQIELAGDDGAAYPAGYGSIAGSTIVGRYLVEVDAETGEWTVDLPANDEIEPTGTVWRVVILGKAVNISQQSRYITVPAGAGTYTVEELLSDPPSAIVPVPVATLRLDYYAALARDPDGLIVGTITRDGNGAATSAQVVWPDGTPGTYTADTLSTAFPGAVDAYHVTYGAPATRTYTQPAVTRDGNGAVTDRPALVVS